MPVTMYEMSTLDTTVTPALIDADATTTGTTVDLAQRALGFRSALIVAVAGDIADGTYSIAVEHSDDGSNWDAVDADHLQGTFVDIDDTASGTSQMVGYWAGRRYLRANVTAADTTDGGTVGVLVIPGFANQTVDHG